MKFEVFRAAKAHVTYHRVVEADTEEGAMAIADAQMECMNNWNIEDIVDWQDYTVTERKE